MAGMDPAAQNLLAGPRLPVHGLILVQVVAQGGAVQRNARERPRERDQERIWHASSVRLRGGVAPHRTGRGGGVRAQREFAGGQMFHAALVQHQQYDVRGRDADLEPKPSAFDADGGRRSPALPVGGAANRNPRPYLAPTPNAAFFNPGTSTMHGDLSSKSWGMALSGADITSLNRSAASSSRSAVLLLSWAAANGAQPSVTANANVIERMSLW